jgi:Right handed beta helix region
MRSPYRTFERLAESLRPGMVGCLRAGVYGDGSTTQSIGHGGRAGQRVTIRGYPHEHVTVAGPVFVYPRAEYVTVSHVTVEGATNLPTGDKRLALEIWGRRFIFEDSVLTNHSGGRSGILIRGDETLIRRDKIYDVGTVGSTFGYAHGIYVAESHNFKIERNWIYDCRVGWGVQLYPHATNGIVAQNIIDGCGAGITIGGDGEVSSRDNRIERNLITNSVGLGRFNPGTAVAGCCDQSPNGNVVIGNVFWANRGGAFDGYRGRSYVERRNISSNPRYVNRARKDFRVRGRKARALGLWNGVFLP